LKPYLAIIKEKEKKINLLVAQNRKKEIGDESLLEERK